DRGWFAFGRVPRRGLAKERLETFGALLATAPDALDPVGFGLPAHIRQVSFAAGILGVRHR
ncbi:MAG TPA: hypothetical protein VJZ98_07180, partial [Actinomycetota bacterium]|nr:hypothetical protein [Actinomycetota bacterium]